MKKISEKQYTSGFVRNFRPVLLLGAALLCLGIFTDIRPAGATETLILDNPQACYNAESYLDVLWDKEGTLTIDQVRTEPLRGTFQNISSKEQNKVVTPQQYWYRLRVRQPELYADDMSNTWALDMRELMFTGKVQLYIESVDEQGGGNA